jgi:hypothetical protein
MKRLVTVLLSLSIILVSSLIEAQPIQDIPPGEDNITSVRKGQIVPFDGQIFDAATALRWANWLQQLRSRLELDVQKEKDACRVETTHRDTLLAIEHGRSTAVETDVRDRLKRAEESRLKAEEALRSRPFYETVEFGMIMGAVVTAGVFALSVWAVDVTAAE